MGDFKKTEDQALYLLDNDMSFEIGKSAITENMFFVGEQDIEDSINDDIWIKILNEYYLGVLKFSSEEISNWKKAVVKKTKCNDYEKFYPILEKGIKTKCDEERIEYDTLLRIPSKGAESANFLKSHITSKNDIPEKIREAFDKLRG